MYRCNIFALLQQYQGGGNIYKIFFSYFRKFKIIFIWDQLVRTQDFLKKLTFLNPWYTHVILFSFFRNVTFSNNFAYVLNEWSFNFVGKNIKIVGIIFVDISRNLNVDGWPSKENRFGQSALLMNAMYIVFP